jgi:glycosyltransferase involved in cell wall biosynthesis
MSGLTNYSPDVKYDPTFAGRLRRPLARFTGRHAHIVALNETGLDELRLAGARRATKINNGVDVDRFRPPSPEERQELRERLGFPEDTFVFVFTGRFVFKKGIDLLLAAFDRVTDRPPAKEVRLCLVGSGDLQADTISCLISKRIEAGAPWLYVFPATTDVAPFLRAADAFVFPSRKEGMPNSVLEALAVGLPCVLSDIRPHRELLAENPKAQGDVFTSGDPESLALALRRRADQSMDGPSSDRLDEKFHMSSVAARYVRLYARALERVRVTL